MNLLARSQTVFEAASTNYAGLGRFMRFYIFRLRMMKNLGLRNLITLVSRASLQEACGVQLAQHLSTHRVAAKSASAHMTCRCQSLRENRRGAEIIRAREKPLHQAQQGRALGGLHG